MEKNNKGNLETLTEKELDVYNSAQEVKKEIRSRKRWSYLAGTIIVLGTFYGFSSGHNQENKESTYNPLLEGGSILAYTGVLANARRKQGLAEAKFAEITKTIEYQKAYEFLENKNKE
jgi:hypothetical protein